MKIGVIGSGVVGQVLSNGFLKYGHEVMIGTRDPSKLNEFKEKTENKILVGNFEETSKFGELIVLAVKGTGAKEALKMAGENLNNKIIIDTTNPIADDNPEEGVLKFFTSLDKSLMEELQEEFPSAHFVKAFNSIGNAFMVNPDFNGQKPTMFICGNSSDAKGEVANIIKQFGFDVEDMGSLKSARAIEPLCILWCIPGFLRNEWSHAFKLLKK